MPRVLFKDWRPDIPNLLNNGVTVAKNCVPVAGGFGPLPSLVDAGQNALTLYCRGGHSVVDASRNTHNFAGDETKLYRIYTSGLEDISKVGGYSCNGDRRWVFETFSNQVFAANPNDPLQVFTLGASSKFADVADAPRFRHLGVVGNFLVGGNYFDSVDGSVPNGIAWPAIANPTYWPDPGSDAAALVQSDRQPLEGDGGWVQAVLPGAEVGAIFQERAIWRMDYRGGGVVFELNRVEPSYGLLVPGLAVPFGRAIFFLAENGFRIFDYTQSVPAGKERVDRWFFNDYDSTYPHRVSAIRDPDSTRIWVSYPGAGNTAGTPNKLLVYDFALNRFAHGDEAIECLVRYVTPTLGTLDSPPAEDIDASSGSFDDEQSAPGAFSIGAWATTHKLGSYTGANKDVTLESGNLEFVPGRRSKVRSVRPLVDGNRDTKTSIAALADTSDAVVYGKKIALDRTGRCPHRSNGRYHRIKTEIDGADFVEALGLDVDALPEGSR